VAKNEEKQEEKPEGKKVDEATTECPCHFFMSVLSISSNPTTNFSSR
jgi:hypothetical protein